MNMASKPARRTKTQRPSETGTGRSSVMASSQERGGHSRATTHESVAARSPIAGSISEDWRKVASDSPHLWQRAASMAARFHQGQFRKDGRTPYVAHPMRVTMIIRDVYGFGDETTLAAALLHDLIEDTRADYDDVAVVCGPSVADLVAALTKDMRQPEAKREPAYDRQLASAPWQARLIKLGDVYDNVCDALPGKQREKAIEKALRAIELCSEDSQLAGAVGKLEALISRYHRSAEAESGAGTGAKGGQKGSGNEVRKGKSQTRR